MILNNKNLYHFTTVDTLTNYILKDNRLKFNNLYKMNDPKEANCWPFKFYDENSELSYLKINKQTFEAVDRYVKTHWLIACFKEEPCVTNDTDINDRTRAYFDMRMWDQYGDKHKGVCIIFDYEKLLSTFSISNEYNTYHGSVKYLSEYANSVEDPFALSFHQINLFGLNNTLETQIPKFHEEFFFTKSLSWSGEHEFRIVLHSKEKEAEYYLHDFKDAISGIILGYQVRAQDQKDICNNFGKELFIYRILSNNWHNEIVPIEDDNPNTISLNGISYSTLTPANYFVVKAQNLRGETILILINSKGEVIPL
ncbi:MAG: DUF2971 domain-containing protein [Oscillospiraceae bacterium]|nr:DUF2971 domain-containing protein [Oscillospiraceae bacterium]